MRVLSVGHCTLDHIGLVEYFARDDEEVEMPTFSVQGGGAAATAAVALARWGASTRFIGKVGDDQRGERIERTLSDEGVATDHFVYDKGKISQVRFVLVEASSGDRHAYSTPGNVGSLQSEEVDSGLVDDHDLLIVDGVFPEVTTAMMKRARKSDIPVVLKADHDREALTECISHASVVVASEREASAFTGVGRLEGICEAFLERGPDVAIVTLGDEGAVALSRNEGFTRVGARSIKMVDPTGAADVFLGAVGLGVLQKWGLEKLIGFANAAAAVACTGPGGRSSIADRATLESEIAG